MISSLTKIIKEQPGNESLKMQGEKKPKNQKNTPFQPWGTLQICFHLHPFISSLTLAHDQLCTTGDSESDVREPWVLQNCLSQVPSVVLAQRQVMDGFHKHWHVHTDKGSPACRHCGGCGCGLATPSWRKVPSAPQAQARRELPSWEDQF